jgi:hypothetical protein
MKKFVKLDCCKSEVKVASGRKEEGTVTAVGRSR